MKNLHVVTILKAFLLLALLTASCKEDDFFDPDGGSIGGVVLYRDYLTNQLDTASNAVIKIKSRQGSDSQTYELEANNGRFEANFLKKGVTYEIEFSYSANQYEYSKDTTLKVENNNPEFYILDVNKESELFRARLRLSGRLIYNDITVDQNRFASGAMVELTAGSNIYTATADANGEFVFENLDKDEIKLTASLRKEINGLWPFWYKKTLELTYKEYQWKVKSENDQDKIDLDSLNLDIAKELLINPMAIITVKKLVEIKELPNAEVDSVKIRLPNAEVFLYRSDSSLESDTLRIAPVAKGTSNERGIVLFGSLDPETYYIHGRVITGEDTINYNDTDKIKWGNDGNLAKSDFVLTEIEEK